MSVIYHGYRSPTWVAPHATAVQVTPAVTIVSFKPATGGGGGTMGIPFGNESTAFAGGKTFMGLLRRQRLSFAR